jgi:hypothetical protein
LNFATDVWTSPNHRAYITVTIHFEDKGVPVSMLLDIVQVARSHSGANLVTVFAKTLDDFGIADKVSMQIDIMDQSRLTYVQILGITCDNASNNDVMIQELEDHIPRFPGASNQIRCFAHILNLVAKSILKQFDVPKATATSILDGDVDDLLELAGEIDVEEDETKANLDEDDEDEDDNVDGWMDERSRMSKEELQNLSADVLPVCRVLVKASST